MNLSDEMIASYIEGTLPEKECQTMRRYLERHPEELERILLVMDSNKALGEEPLCLNEEVGCWMDEDTEEDDGIVMDCMMDMDASSFKSAMPMPRSRASRPKNSSPRTMDRMAKMLRDLNKI